MRIISGKFKGRILRFQIPANIRPSTDSTRQAVFDTLSNYTEFEGIRVLDLFSGTGMFGFEALSRGAGFCHFVDKNSSAIKLIHLSAKMLSINPTNFKVTLADAFAFLNTYEPDTKFDLTFSDPPYEKKYTEKLLTHPRLPEMLTEKSLLLCEISCRESIQIPAHFNLIMKKNIGDTSILLLSYFKK
ncbi:MAG: RsmD family RNA methyltransferase [Candidatus Kapaibacteriales bacterium]